MTKIDIISGFLGAGKTTLIRKLIEEVFAGQKIVLIENEFGEIGIDGGFLKDAGINITEMNSGCICCSLVGDFGEALKKVMEQFAPDRILIEPSGVGKLSDVCRAVEDVASDCDMKVNSLTTVADAKKIKMYMKNFGEFYNNQVESAGTIVLSRTQELTPEKLDEAIAMIRSKNEKATVITTPWDQITGAQILEAMEGAVSLVEELRREIFTEDEDEDEDEHEHHHHHHDHEEHEHHHDHDEEHEHHHDHDEEHEHHHHHHHHHHGHDADEVFVSWGAETPRKYTKEELESCLTALDNEEEYGLVLRAKGMIPAEDGTWLYFDMVPGEHEIRCGEPEVTGRLCVIGSKLSAEKLNELFHAEGRFSDLD
ncbi:MAG: GTP-binding protein [Lachnospiraceae bacterium]|nr:GTP-binding protein [Lachnospiraceae bacterium]